MTERLRDRLGRPVDAAWLAAFRILFGLVMAFSALRFLAYGWIDDFWVTPRYHFTYRGFGWVEPLSARGMHALFWVLCGLAIAIAAGFCFRLACGAFLAGFVYVQLIDVATYLNHYVLAALLAALLLVSPAGKTWSIDAWLAGRAGGNPAVQTLWLWLFRLQIGAVYTYAGLAKANADWLIHAQPLRIWLTSRTGLPVVGPLLAQSWTPLAMSWGGFLFDSTVVWFLLARRTRPFAYAAVIVFHVLTRLLFPIGMFPVIMILSALVFFSPSWPRFGRETARQGSRPSGSAPVRGPVLALAGAYVALQVLVPLRALAYPGDVRWHEQGMRFSWRVMVREKNGSVTFLVRSKTTGHVWHVSPRTMLTRTQEREMAGQPDLILQLAHAVRDDFARRGHGPVEVRVDAIASLNGRRLAPLVDPDVDLACVEDGVLPARWILPLPASAPPHIHST